MRRDAHERSSTSDVIVIGGGFHGISSALHLARRGAQVTLLEAEYCGRHASGVNAGGVRTLGRHLAEIPLARASLESWHALDDLIGSDGTFVASGQLQIAETEAELELQRKRISSLHELGHHHEVLVDAKQARELVPLLAKHVVGGIWVSDDGHAIPYHVVTEFRRAAERHGAEIHESTAAQLIERRGDLWHVSTSRGEFSAPWIVNTAGAWAGDFATQAGDVIPVSAGGLMLMITQRVPHFIDPVLGAKGRPLSFKQFSNGTVLIGGALHCAADVIQRHGEVEFFKLSSSAKTVTDLFPHLAGINIVRAWAGVEAFMPDQIPVIGRSQAAPNLVHAFGFSAHGFELGPICGRVISEIVLDGEASINIDAFRADRFMQRTESSESIPLKQPMFNQKKSLSIHV